MTGKMIFVSSPYTSQDPAVTLERYENVCKYTAELVASGQVAFSPIVYGHTLLSYAKMPSDWQFWKNFCESFLSKCAEVHVLTIPGWQESTGVAAEIAFAESKEIPIKYIRP